VAVLVHDDARVQICQNKDGETLRVVVIPTAGNKQRIGDIGTSILHGHGPVPEVHPHARALPVGRRGKVGVVVSGAILGVGLHSIVALAALAKVVLLEITGRLSEPVLVEDIVDDVVPITQRLLS
jgi:hypothetical protein